MNMQRGKPGRPPLSREPRPIVLPVSDDEAASGIRSNGTSKNDSRDALNVGIPEDGTLVARPAPEPAPAYREPPREEDPRARAARRAAELRDVVNTIVDSSDEFYISPEVIPDGWTYEWKTAQVYGKDESSRMLEFRRTGWEEVPTRRHPEMMPLGTDAQFITRKGMVLMERPTVITQDFENRLKRDAYAQVRQKEAEARGGEKYVNSDKGFENRSAGIKHGWDRGPSLPSASQLEVPDY